ncbi:MAG: carboxypeptidase-like regulatory domain-containing protein [Gemmatimonadota bacterium]|nr:carboxypeptidase-like regulatory domain-containing protein [Gemmatimonadota bacterium]
MRTCMCYSILSSIVIGGAACVPPTEPPRLPPGTASVSGRIRDGVGQAVSGVSVRVPVRTGYYGATTNSQGKFEIIVPLTGLQNVSPVAVFAVKDGFRPYYAWYTELAEGASYIFSTPDDRPFTELDVGEFVPPGLVTLVHLGDGTYSGSANSQLQVDARGTDLAYHITTWTPELEAFATRVVVTFSARGIETTQPDGGCPGNAVVVITDAGVYEWATPSNSDPSGDFSGYALAYNLPSIQPGQDIYLRLISGAWADGDQGDDFEIAGVLVRFEP